MSNEKFTPGPWELTTVPIESRGGGQVCHKIGSFVACIYDDGQNAGRGIYTDELKANANLIAAAPDMYEALIYCANFEKQLPSKVYALIKAALNKACPQ